MFIRSQSKKSLYNLNMVKALFVNGGSVYADANLIGEYSTDEKALKVLDMIQQSYINTFSILNEQMLQDPYWTAVKESSNVFIMPQEDKL